MPAFRTFVDWLATKAAIHTAEAGNALLVGDESSPLEAEEFAKVARKYMGAWEIMAQFADRDFKPEHARLLPRPLTTKTT